MAVVQKYANEKKTRAAAEAYLRFLYTPAAQEIAAKHFFRPELEEVAQRHTTDFPPMRLFTIRDVCGTWNEAQKTHFNEGGIFDQIARARR